MLRSAILDIARGVLAGRALHITSKTGSVLFYGAVTSASMLVVYLALVRGSSGSHYEMAFMLLCGMYVFDLLF